MYDIEANFFKQVKSMLELLTSFTTKAHDDICRECDPRPQLTYASNLFPVLIQRIATFHALEELIVAGLYRDIQVFANLWQVCHALNHTIGHMARIRGHETNTLQSIDLAKLAHQVGQVGLAR